MYSVRRWAISRSNLFEELYNLFEPLFIRLHPVWNRLGYRRVEGPVSRVEHLTKGFLFDCRMCGQCMLRWSGMSCPMNCPKGMRNGPCGGVRRDGGCEVEPAMPCVWVEAWEGSRKMHSSGLVSKLQGPLDHTLMGRSSWLRVARTSSESQHPCKGHST